jgi:hypothetical protein
LITTADWDGPGTGFSVTGATAYLDTLTLYCYRPLPYGVLGALRREYGKKLIVDPIKIPKRKLHGREIQRSFCVLNRQDINISDITKVADVNLDSFAATLVAAVTKRKSDYKERTTFIPDRPGHLIKLIVGLIQHYGALTETEIEVLLYAMELKSSLRRFQIICCAQLTPIGSCEINEVSRNTTVRCRTWRQL